MSNQKINAIAEDAQGHIWIGTFRGLNKYYAHTFHQYFCVDDSLGLPDNQVTDILSDSKGRLWVATVNGVCRYTDKDSFRRIGWGWENHNVADVFEDGRGRVFATSYPRLLLYDEDTESFETVIDYQDSTGTWIVSFFVDGDDRLWSVDPYRLTRWDPDSFRVVGTWGLGGGFTSLCKYVGGRLWLVSSGELTVFDTRRGVFLPLPEAMSRNRQFMNAELSVIHEYGENGLIFCTVDAGMFYWDADSGRLFHESESGFPFDAPQTVASVMFTDSQGNLWIGSVEQGVKVIYHYKERFNDDNGFYTSFAGKSVKATAVDEGDNVWISTMLDGNFLYKAPERRIVPLRIDDYDAVKWGGYSYVKGLAYAGDGDFWAIRTDHKVAHYELAGESVRLLRSYPIFAPMTVAVGPDGSVWVGSAGAQIYCMRPGEEEFQAVKLFEGYTFIPTIIPFDAGRMLVCGFNNPPTLVDIQTLEASALPIADGDWDAAIARSVFIPVVAYKGGSGDVWIGTVANGLLRYDIGSLRMTRVEGAACTDISSIEEDEVGDLWIGTLYGLSRLNVADSTFTNYFDTDGIGGNQFYDRASCKLSDGRIAFGGTHGITFFRPRILGGTKRIPLLFEELKVHGEPVSPLSGGIIDRHLSYNPPIRLRHSQNSFSISFAALDYSEYERVTYSYKLEGFDSYWIDGGHVSEAIYSNVPAGRYHFRVRLESNDSNIESAENVVDVRVLPAPYATWWAWAAYALLLSGIAAWFIVSRVNIRRERLATEEARRAREQEHALNEKNMTFFSNISHEFRTPLTLISGPIAYLADKADLPQREHEMALAAKRSVGRMLRLVGQFLDFNKLESGAMRLSVCVGDMVAALDRIVEAFRVSMEDKGICLTTEGLEDTFLTWMDEDKVDKIVTNLMSNALKFTPDGGTVELAFDVVDAAEVGRELPGGFSRHVKVSVTNSGSEIPEDERERIFERYYQISGADDTQAHRGTGIGLYYARHLARLHHGDLFCTEPEGGGGVTFTLAIPADVEAYSADDKRRQSSSSLDRTYEPWPQPVAEPEREAVPEEGRRRVMVIDDDPEIAMYMRNVLSPTYNVTCRFDADSALQAMRQVAPDCILCDVVMPGKDGFELCKEVRADLRLCHIPLILVTADVEMEKQVRGLNTGADAYVTKPFSPDLLLAVIKSRISAREDIQKALSGATQADGIQGDLLSPEDERFMKELHTLVEEELSNPELNILAIAGRLHISRTKLYYKIKGLTGENPGAFFRNYKLNRAAELIREGRYTLSEVADMTGFSNLSVFSKAFKKQFGVMPSKFQ